MGPGKSYCTLALLRAANDATTAPAIVPAKHAIRTPRAWTRKPAPCFSTRTETKRTTIIVAFSTNMMGQSLRNAWGLPRDNRNWQMKKYAAIKITVAMGAALTPKILSAVSPTNINTTKDKTPRKKAPNTFNIFALPFQTISKPELSSLAAPTLSRDTDLGGDDEARGAGHRPWPLVNYRRVATDMRLTDTALTTTGYSARGEV